MSGSLKGKDDQTFGSLKDKNGFDKNEPAPVHIVHGEETKVEEHKEEQKEERHDDMNSQSQLSQGQQGQGDLSTWDFGPQNRMRPINYKPNGSFKALKETGKLSTFSQTQTQTQTQTKTKTSSIDTDKDSHMPGYTGFIRGSQHIQGRTYGEMTRRALEKDYREHACTSPIPSAPQSNRKIPQNSPEDSFISTNFSNKAYHIPGYTGFVPGVRSAYARSYGATTNDALDQHQEQFSPTRSGAVTSQPGFADTVRARKPLTLDSASLPGAASTNKPPQKLVPNHLKYLKFLAQ